MSQAFALACKNRCEFRDKLLELRWRRRSCTAEINVEGNQMTASEGRGNVTADDVAAAAGVSRWTVNRAFKKEASISPATRRS